MTVHLPLLKEEVTVAESAPTASFDAALAIPSPNLRYWKSYSTFSLQWFGETTKEIEVCYYALATSEAEATKAIFGKSTPTPRWKIMMCIQQEVIGKDIKVGL